MHRTTLLLAALALLAGQGCAIYDYPLQLPTRPAEPLPADVSQRFEYAVVSSATLTTVWTDSEVEVSDGVFMIKFPAAPGAPDDVLEIKFEYWRSLVGKDPAPVIVVTPILGGGKELARGNCRDFARAGFHVILAWRGTKVLRRSWEIEKVEAFLRKSIASRMAMLDWAETRSEIDSQRMAAFGISMGGILSSVFVAVEPRLHSAVIALAGCDLAQIVRVSSEQQVIDFRDRKLEERSCSPQELEEVMRKTLVSDPMLLMQYVDPRKVFMITTRWDSVVPPENQLRLWEGFGRPQRLDLPASHYSGIMYLPVVTRHMVLWFRKRMLPEGVMVPASN